MNNILSINNLYKNFGPVEVIKGLDFTLEKGEVRALLGANGAGKSTLIKIICGALNRSEGDIFLKGEPLEISTPLEGLEHGISVIHQELSVIPQMTVLDNFFLGREITKNGFVDRKAMVKSYNEVREKMDFDIPHNVLVRNLTVANRQVIEIMKAVSYDADIIIMDEPTSSLSETEKQNLFKIIGQLKKEGKTIIYISHMLDEIFQICDNASVMFDGKIVSTLPVDQLTPEKIAHQMSGGIVKRANIGQKRDIDYSVEPVMLVRNLSRGHYFNNVSFELYPGEILGIAGLVGSGRSEIVRCLFGADRHDSGEIIYNGEILNVSSPTQAIKNRIGLIPEDRKQQGLVLKHPIYMNADILALDKVKKNGLLNRKKEIAYTDQAKEELSILMDSPYTISNRLSGGNQQKVVVSKWLESDLDVLIFDEPTKGIDVNSKEDIFSTILKFANKGVAIIFISSDIEEVIRVSDRIMVLDKGKIKKILPNENLTENHIMNEIFAMDNNIVEEI